MLLYTPVSVVWRSASKGLRGSDFLLSAPDLALWGAGRLETESQSVLQALLDRWKREGGFGVVLDMCVYMHLELVKPRTYIL